MEAESSISVTVPIPAVGIRHLLRGGRDALKTVPGTRRFLVKGVLLTYLISLILAVLLAVVAYYALVDPALTRVDQWGMGQGTVKEAASAVVKGLLWVGLVIVVLASQVVAFLLTLSMMGLWFEAVVERVVRFRRGSVLKPPANTLSAWLRSAWASLKDSVFLVVLAVLALLLGLVPVVGPLIGFVLNSYLMGREVRDPYVAVRSSLGDRPRDLVKNRRGWTIRTGAVPVLIAMIPGVGWILLPMVMVYLTTGLAWVGEDAVESRQATQIGGAAQ